MSRPRYVPIPVTIDNEENPMPCVRIDDQAPPPHQPRATAPALTLLGEAVLALSHVLELHGECRNRCGLCHECGQTHPCKTAQAAGAHQ